MLKIESRQWVAVLFRCPSCGGQSGHPRLTPYQYKHLSRPICWNYGCNDCEREIVEHRWYTTHCIEDGISFSTVAGTLAQIGPFKTCDVVHRNITEFRRWYRRRRAEVDAETRAYREAEAAREAEFQRTHIKNPNFVEHFVTDDPSTHYWLVIDDVAQPQ